MKKFALILGITGLASMAILSAQQVEKRVAKLEKRVDRVEDRVSTIEESGGGMAGDNARDNLKVQPLKVTLISRKQTAKAGRVGLDLVLTFKNLTNYDLNGFSGRLVFKPEGGDIYTRKIAYSHLVESGDTAQIALTLSVDDTKSYLKFVKAKSIKVVFVDQKLF
jgi:hypothetical protein